MGPRIRMRRRNAAATRKPAARHPVQVPDRRSGAECRLNGSVRRSAGSRLPGTPWATCPCRCGPTGAGGDCPRSAVRASPRPGRRPGVRPAVPVTAGGREGLSALTSPFGQRSRAFSMTSSFFSASAPPTKGALALLAGRSSCQPMSPALERSQCRRACPKVGLFRRSLHGCPRSLARWHQDVAAIRRLVDGVETRGVGVLIRNSCRGSPRDALAFSGSSPGEPFGWSTEAYFIAFPFISVEYLHQARSTQTVDCLGRSRRPATGRAA